MTLTLSVLAKRKKIYQVGLFLMLEQTMAFLLQELAKQGFSDLTGNDYSEGAINLAISLANHDGFNSTKLLVEDVLETKLDKNFEPIMDKETLDIGLHQDGSIKRNMYWESMSRLMASAGVLVSCYTVTFTLFKFFLYIFDFEKFKFCLGD
ncbi:hypothetical protein LXL04_038638 [Taraxacum kok-saghyz]